MKGQTKDGALRRKVNLFNGDPLDQEAVASAVADCETLLVAPPAWEGSRAEALDRATRGMWAMATAAVHAGVERIVLRSTLKMFARIPRNWSLDTNWRPRPAPELTQLCPYLMERSLMAIARASGLHASIVRLGDDVPDDAAWQAALAEPSVPLRILHLGNCGDRPASDGDKPWRTILAPVAPVPQRPLTRIALLGAAGPLASAVADELSQHYELRLADVQSITEAKRQSPTAPLAHSLPPPHAEILFDVRDLASVMHACRGCDAIVNLTVMRSDPRNAFQVNALGAYNVGLAAAHLGIRRVVQTGPQLLALDGEHDFTHDFDFPMDAPPRPGCDPYSHSKFLGNEALRVLAEWYDLVVPNLMFSGLAQPDAKSSRSSPPLMTSWQDGARAIRCALETPNLPSPYEEFLCVADFPHGQVRNDKAQRLLGWSPNDSLHGLWRR